MTSTRQSLHMYADSAIRFRDPFAVSKGLTPPTTTFQTHQFPQTHRASQTGYSNHSTNTTTLTPPPEMNSFTQPTSQENYGLKEHGPSYGDHMSSQQPRRPSLASYLPPELSNGARRNSVNSQSVIRSPSARQPQGEVNDDYQVQHGAPQNNAIASNFQIPRSVNESGGSLAELAAQSSEMLQEVEDTPTLLYPSRVLASDARPTTGFRKWVTTILSTTMVAQNVVVLALLFIHRLKKLNPGVKGKPGSEYRLLTVALMLGNKFLDDNTYTNKTWAEVSGINVGEVHIMEVEFLSNMKYCLFTSEQDWARWQSLLGKFAAFFERASKPLAAAHTLAPLSSVNHPISLPSPPASNQASPPYPADLAQHTYSNSVQHGPTPAPSPLGNYLDQKPILNPPVARKRSHDEHATEPPPKRIANGYQSYTSPQRYSTLPVQPAPAQPAPRLTLPSLSIPNSQGHAQQLPPLNVPARAMAMVYSTPSQQVSTMQPQVSAGPSSHLQSQSQIPLQLQRGQSPHGDSAAASPLSAVPHSATALRPPHQISPTYFLQQRSSPYRPVQQVSTLLYPPPSTAIQSRPRTVDLNQMQYQPLGRSVQHSGRLPYVSQNMWLDGNQPHEMTPIHQWPGMSTYAGLQHQQQQHPPLH